MGKVSCCFRFTLRTPAVQKLNSPHSLLTGGTLRESLKYSSVERVTMVDLDAKVIEVSRKYLPSYSNCTGFGTQSCFDDPRTDVYAEDFFKWFEKHLGNDICDTRKEKSAMLYDVIILDLLDPEALPDEVWWAEYLYSEAFFKRIACTLHDDGVLVSNFGEAPEAPFVGGPVGFRQDVFFKERTEIFMDKIEKIRNLSANFKNTRVYDAAIPSYRANWAFALGVGPRLDGSKKKTSHQGLNDFEGSPALVNRKLKERLLPGASTKYYKGHVHHGFQYPTADWKGVYCVVEGGVCEDPKKAFASFDKHERALWHPVMDTIRSELTATL